MHGYYVEFLKSDGDFFDTLAKAVYVRNKVCGGGLIYAAHFEKSGFNTFVQIDYLCRKNDSTPL